MQLVSLYLCVQVRQLAALLAVSTSTVIYSGAGISTAAGIAPAARSSCNTAASDLTTDAVPRWISAPTLRYIDK